MLRICVQVVSLEHFHSSDGGKRPGYLLVQFPHLSQPVRLSQVKFAVEYPNGSLGGRQAYPVQVAFAMSVHQAQAITSLTQAGIYDPRGSEATVQAYLDQRKLWGGDAQES